MINNQNCDKCFNFILKDKCKTQWEEQRLDLSKSPLNYKIEYKSLFKIIEPCYDIKKICLPEHWFLGEEDILDIEVNNIKCSYYKCLKGKEHLVLDLMNTPITKEINVLFIKVYTQDIMEFYTEAFKGKLSKFSTISKNTNIIIKIKKLERKYYSEGLFISRFFSRFRIFPRFNFEYLFYSEDFETERKLDIYVKIPKFCKFKNITNYKRSSYDIIDFIQHLYFLKNFCAGNLKKLIKLYFEKYEKLSKKDYSEKIKKLKCKLYKKKDKFLFRIKNFRKWKLKKYVKNYFKIKNNLFNINKILTYLKVKSTEKETSTEEEPLIEEGRQKLETSIDNEITTDIKDSNITEGLIYQLSKEDYELYHLKEERFSSNLKLKGLIIYKIKTKIWTLFPLIFVFLLIIISLVYFTFLATYFLEPFNGLKFFFNSIKFSNWDFLKISMTVSIWALIALNWEASRQLRTIKSNLLVLYIIFLFILLACSIIIILLPIHPSL